MSCRRVVDKATGREVMLGEATTKMTMVYWRSDRFWLGKLLEHPEIMTQGDTVEELEENIKDAYLLMAMDEVPEEYQVKEVVI
ncbi:MAG TPA: hypothetical protein PKC65_06335 [Pyrinomonadaceae bacterium]|nr:hypothetical protein [Pyrinomonadaceae bacterium]HMU32897.1 hypothetical protein [Pyrinomonadaceae bacterium]